MLVPHVLNLQLLDHIWVDLAGLVRDDWVLVLLALFVLAVVFDEQVTVIAVLDTL